VAVERGVGEGVYDVCAHGGTVPRWAPGAVRCSGTPLSNEDDRSAGPVVPRRGQGWEDQRGRGPWSSGPRRRVQARLLRAVVEDRIRSGKCRVRAATAAG